MKFFNKETISKASTRRRVGMSAIAAGLVLFILTTPILGWTGDLIRNPNELRNIQIIRTNKEIQVSWDRAVDSDIKEYVLELTNHNQKIVVDKNVDNYTFKELKPTEEYNLAISSKDLTGRKATISKRVPPFNDQSEVFFLNNTPVKDNQTASILIRTTLVSISMLIFSLWITQFNFSSIKHITIGLYPTVVLIPYSFITLSFLYSETEAFSKFLLSFIFALIFSTVSYLLLLTMNILNASLSIQLPLEQAAKAAQFVFSLISSYLILILFFGSGFTIIEKLVFVTPFVFYFSFSAILMLKDINFNQVLVRTFSITLTMVFAIMILSMWPVNYVFAMISSAVVFYILLSITLEVRYKITKSIWTEYIILLLLIIILLVSNSSWGIKGSLI